MKIFFAAVNCSYRHSCPAIFALKRDINPVNHHIFWAQWTINTPFKEIVAAIYKAQPDIISFSVYIWNVNYLERLIPFLRSALPDSLIILGGPQVIGEGRRILSRFLLADGFHFGEGEGFFSALLNSLEEGQAKPFFPGLLWQGDSFDYAIPTIDFAMIPFLYKKEDLRDLKNHIIYYESSRGCPYSCTFCASAKDPLRQRPLHLVLSELTEIALHHGGQVKFVDRTFNADSQRAKLIIEHLLGLYKPGLSWHFEISSYHVDDNLLAGFMQAPPGYFRLEAGVQSLNPLTLKAVNRSGNWKKAENNLEKLMEKDNLHLHLDLIAGLPYENWGSFEQGFAKLHNLAPHYLQLGFLKVLPGSEMERQIKQFGLKYSEHPPYEVIQTPTLSGGEMILLGEAENMLDSFYNCGRFRQTLFQLALLWPNGPLDIYLKLAELKQDQGALSVAKKAQLLWRLCQELSGQKEFLKDVLLFDWYAYGSGEPFPVEILGEKIPMPLKLSHCPINGKGGIFNWQSAEVKLSFKGLKRESASGWRAFSIQYL